MTCVMGRAKAFDLTAEDWARLVADAMKLFVPK
jgi:hypothetical protein